MKKPIFKPIIRNEMVLRTTCHDDEISSDHLVRLLDKVVDKIDISFILSQYKGGGAPSYHPSMLIKVLIYAYIQNIYSSRRIEEAIKTDIHFRWLCGGHQPDHNTINNFRSQRLSDYLECIFSQVVVLLNKGGVLSFKEQYLDGTKIEANANKYSFVWRKRIESSEKRMRERLKELWAYTQEVAKDEMNDKILPDLSELKEEDILSTIDTINDALKKKTVDADVKRKINYAKKKYPETIKKNKEQIELMEKRNSLSKTDPDATFMRMKDDHMKNGQLKAGYNVQITTNNQFVTTYSLHQKPSDSTTLIPHMEKMEANFAELPEVICADAGYGSEENNTYLEQKGIEAYVKYPGLHKEEKRERSTRPKYSLKDTYLLYYNEEEDVYYCPSGQKMKNIGSFTRHTTTGFPQYVTEYQAENCKGCPMKGACYKAKENRKIQISHQAVKYRKKAKERLQSEEGIRHRKRRCWDVETVFGNIKQNMNFTRFMLRGLNKVSIEFGLVAMAHNLKKAWKMGLIVG